jgi:FdhD protein
MAARLQRLFSSVAVVSNRPAYVEHCLKVPVYTDAFPGLGPLAGVHAGLTHSRSGSAFFLGCDMPLLPDEAIARVTAAASASSADAVVARTPRGPEPLCGVYRKGLLPAVESRLLAGRELSIGEFLKDSGAQFVEFGWQEAQWFRDIDRPEDVSLLKEAFTEVEPLPVRRQPVTRFGGPPLAEDIVVEERPVALRVNGIHLVTILCLPAALTELAAGYLSYLGLAGRWGDLKRIQVDYEAGRVSAELALDEDSLRSAVRLQISSSCGAGIYGPPLPHLTDAGDAGFRVRADHILDVLTKLRSMAPVFERTGATHQAAFTDGQAVMHFYEDVGRHNAIDKVIGRALMDGTDLTHGALVATGRLNAEMVVKAVRQGIPVAATRSAVTGQALELAGAYGMTVVGFARAGRLNIYTSRHRVLPR